MFGIVSRALDVGNNVEEVPELVRAEQPVRELYGLLLLVYGRAEDL